MSPAFNLRVTPFSGHGVGSLREIFQVHGFSMSTKKSSVAVNAALPKQESVSLAKAELRHLKILFSVLLVEIKEKLKWEDNNSLAAATIPPADIPSNLCIIDTLERLGLDGYFESEIDTIVEDTYKLWQQKHKVIYSNVTTHAMAFRLLPVKGYEVSSEELAPYANKERVSQQTIDVAMVMELYLAAHERIYEEETSLEKILAWTTTFLKQQLQSNSILDEKLHKLVGFYLKDYHGITKKLAVGRNLDLYDMSHYQALKATDRFSNLCNEDFLAFSMQEFNICQAQYHKELQQLQRWYADCRLDTLKFRRNVVLICNFMVSLVITGRASDHARLAFVKTSVLSTVTDDFFDYVGSRQECCKFLELVKEWKEKPAADYGSDGVEILFTALYNTVNELSEMARVEQGRSVKEFIIGLVRAFQTGFSIA